MSKESINRQAAHWVVQLQSPECLDSDRDACIIWRAAIADHDQAFLKASRLFGMLAEKLPADPMYASGHQALLRAVTKTPMAPSAPVAAGLQISAAAGSVDDVVSLNVAVAKPVEHIPAPSAISTRERTAGWQKFAVAACLCVGVAILAASEWLAQDVLILESKGRQVQHFTLSDGSELELDADSRVVVEMDHDLRHLQLERGRALFHVAHDRSRPFVVESSGSRVQALGTVFQVARQGTETIVTLTEGAIEVSAKTGSVVLNERLMPGEQLVMNADVAGSWQRSLVDTEAATSWAQGRLVFRDVSLSQLVREVNRYSSTAVVLGSSELESLRISGSFDAGDSRTIAQAVAITLDLRVVDAVNSLILFPPF